MIKYKKTLSILLLICMLISLLPVSAFAEEGNPGDQTDCEHDYAEEVIEPTCGEPGSVTYTCTKCGDSYTEEIPATGEHTFENGVCTVCGAVDPDYVPPHEHTWDEGTVTLAATCIADGVMTYTCTAEDCDGTCTEGILNVRPALCFRTAASCANAPAQWSAAARLAASTGQTNSRGVCWPNMRKGK